MTIPFEIPTLIIAAAAMCAGYVVFGITAFGAALITVPVLSHFYPLDFVLPMCVLVDVSAALAMGARFSREADIFELRWMVPASLIGAILGVTLLVSLSRHATLAAFGLFLLVYGGYSLWQGSAVKLLSRGWAPVAGLAGGVTGTLFAIGGPLYAIYLSRRQQDSRVLRATLSNMVLLSTSIRALVFLASGLIFADTVLLFGLLVPFALLGLWLGNRLHSRISRDGVLRVMSVLLLLMGVSILMRVFAV